MSIKGEFSSPLSNLTAMEQNKFNSLYDLGNFESIVSKLACNPHMLNAKLYHKKTWITLDIRYLYSILHDLAQRVNTFVSNQIMTEINHRNFLNCDDVFCMCVECLILQTYARRIALSIDISIDIRLQT